MSVALFCTDTTGFVQPLKMVYKSRLNAFRTVTDIRTSLLDLDVIDQVIELNLGLYQNVPGTSKTNTVNMNSRLVSLLW